MLLTDEDICERMALPDDNPRRLRITPFVGEQVRPSRLTPSGKKRSVGGIGYGLSGAGYDITLGRRFLAANSPFLSFPMLGGFCPDTIDPTTVAVDQKAGTGPFAEHTADRFIVQPLHFVLAESVEWIDMPEDASAWLMGKSTLARVGMNLNTTLIEPGWCASDDTEIMTQDGWRMLADVCAGDSVLTRREDGVAEYQSVQLKQAMEYNGDLIHFHGKSIDQMVTPNHELFVHHRTMPGKSVIRKLRASDVYGKYNYSFDRSVKWTGPEPETIQIAGRSWNARDFAEFYGSWLGDGSAFLGGDGGYHVKLAVVTKEEKIKRFGDVLSRLGVRFRLRDRGYEFYDKELCLWLREHGHAKDKYINREFLLYGRLILESLLTGLMQSDGCSVTNAYTTVSRRLADDVQELIFKCGRAAIVREEKSYPRGVACNRFVIRDCGGQMTPIMNPKTHSLVPYSGMVYCVTVPNHVFFSRRNGKASWTGNSGRVTVEIFNMFPLPIELVAGEGIGQLVWVSSARPCRTPYNRRPSASYQNQSGACLPYGNVPGQSPSGG